MFDANSTLIAKTFVLLITGLFLTYIATKLTISYFYRAYQQRKPHVTLKKAHADGSQDLVVDRKWLSPRLWAVIIVQFIVFLAMLYFHEFRNDLPTASGLAIAWTLLTGVMLGFAIIDIDESLAVKALQLTAICALATGVIAFFSGVNFEGLGKYLFVALLLFIVLRIATIFIKIDRVKHKVLAMFGIVLFNLYLVYDFNKLSRENKMADQNTWTNALDIAINLYLDLINLFLNILDFIS